MTLARALARYGVGGVNIVPPTLSIVAGGVLAAAGHGLLGAGVAVGGCLALANSAMLLKRIGVAAATGDAVASMIAMQLGLLVTFTAVALITVLMVLISVPMTVAMGVSFFITQTVELILYARGRPKVDSATSLRVLEEEGA